MYAVVSHGGTDDQSERSSIDNCNDHSDSGVEFCDLDFSCSSSPNSDSELQEDNAVAVVR